MVLGRRVRPQTNRRNKERSALEKLSRVSQNQRTNDALASTPLYVTTDFSKSRGMSGLPQTMVSSSGPVNNDSKGTGTTRAIPSRTADTYNIQRKITKNICMTTSRKGLFRDNTNENKRVENPNWHFPEQQQKVAKAGLEPENARSQVRRPNYSATLPNKLHV